MMNILTLFQAQLQLQLQPQIIAEISDSTTNESAIIGALLISTTLIFFISKIWEEICAWLKLPPVLGQLVCGIVLGVSVLNILVFTETSGHTINPNIIKLIEWSTNSDAVVATAAYKNQLIAVSEGAANLGAIALLFLIGLESDFEELVGVGNQAVAVAVTGVVLPFALGTLGLIYLFGTPFVPAIFAGAALTATSIGITAKVLQELNQLQSKEGQIIIGAAIIDDLLGILILAVVVSLVQIGTVNVNDLAYLLLSTTLFVGGVFLFRNQLGNAFVAVTSRMKSDNGLLVVAILFALLWAGIANTIDLEAILGAFVAGIILAGTDKKHEIIEQFQPIANILSPIFFVVVGAKTDLTVLNPANPQSREGLIIAAFLILVAILGKVIAGYMSGNSKDINRLAIGMGMVPRGEIGLVFVGIGTALDILPDALSAAVVLMVIATTFLAPLLLRLIFNSVEEKSVTLTESLSANQ
ncbi:MAG: cation:proton antiporter [Rivularia sp. (in: cyanobacteria)]